ncbi:MAG: hypothetical protein ACRDSJ_24050 [Rubrobacteraceae bacterium]
MDRKLLTIGAATVLTMSAAIPAIAQQSNDATFGEQNTGQSQEATIDQYASGDGDVNQNANVAFGGQNSAQTQANVQANARTNAGESQDAAVEQYAAADARQEATAEFGDQDAAQEQYSAQANLAAGDEAEEQNSVDDENDENDENTDSDE